MTNIKSYDFYFSENYRGDCYMRFCEHDNQKLNDNYEEYYGSVNVPIVEKNIPYRVFFYCWDMRCVKHNVFLKTFKNLEKSKRLCLEVLAHVEECGSIDEANGYSEPVRIKHRKTMKKIPENASKPSVCYVVDSDGNIVHQLSITPP